MTLTASDIYELYNQCVVVVISYNEKEEIISQGSGVILKKQKLLFTNCHLIRSNTGFTFNIKIFSKGKFIEHEGLELFDINKDVLIVKLKDTSDYKQVNIGKNKNIKVGDLIYSIGSPLSYENTIAEGIISNLDNKPDILDFPYDDSYNLIQISAGISSGSSGGAVVNSEGELIGISTFTDVRGQNLNFAIPIDNFMELYKKKTPGKTDSLRNAFLLNYFNGAYETSLVNISDYLKKYDKNKRDYIFSMFLLLKARILLKLNRENEFLITLKEIQEYDPYNIKPYGLLALNHCCHNNYKEALEVLENGIKIIESGKQLTNNTSTSMSLLGDDESEIHEYFGIVYLLKNDNENALKEFNLAINLDPVNFSYYNSIGGYFVINHDLIKANENFIKSINLNKNNFLGYSGLGDIRFAVNEYEDALKFYSHSISLLQAFPEQALSTIFEYCPFIGQCRSLIELNRYDEAISSLEPIRENENIEYIIRELKGSILLSKGEFEKSINELNSSISLNSNNASAYYWRGKYFFEVNDIDNALMDINKSIALNSVDFRFYVLRCNIYLRNNSNIEAIKEAEFIYKLNNDSTEGLSLKALAYEKLSDYNNSEKTLVKLLEKLPNDIDLLNRLGLIYTRSELFEKAEEVFLKLLSLNPTSDNINCNLGYMYYMKVNLKTAVKYFNKAIELNPHNSEAFKLRGYVTKDLGYYNQALSDFEHAIILNFDLESELHPLINEIQKTNR